MSKNPFSIYDFLGYLFPGFIFLVITAFLWHLDRGLMQDYFDFTKYMDVLKSGKDYDWLESTVFVIVFSYVFGHIVAYFSASVVEYFTNHLFGYPSHYLLHEQEINYRNILNHYFEYPSVGNVFWRIVVMVIMLPVTLVILTFGVKFSLIGFVVRPLDDYVRNSILNKLNTLSCTLNLDCPDVNSNADYHRIVMHYVYLNIPNCQRKVDNYVAMYGFLRAMTLISCVLFDYLFIDQVVFSVDLIKNNGLTQCETNWTAIFLFIVILVITNLLYMSFVKFYRRFTLENYMALLTEK